DADRPDEQPVIPAPTPALQEQIRQADARIAALKQQLDTATPQLAAEQAQWEAGLQTRSDWTVLDPLTARSEEGLLRKLPDHSLRAEGPNPANDTYTVTARTDLKGVTAFRLETLPDPALPGGGAGRSPDGNFVLSRLSVTAAPA